MGRWIDQLSGAAEDGHRIARRITDPIFSSRPWSVWDVEGG
jgi:hypothetical protein